MVELINYLERPEFKLLKQYLLDIECNNSILHNCKGIVVSGCYGIGKTTFVKTSLQHLNYDVIEYDHTLSGSKNLENIFEKQKSFNSIINIFNKKKKKIVILIDNLECINKNERGIISEITKQLRGKKTKTQKKESFSLNPVICISSNNIEKKISELSSKIYNIDFTSISNEQLENILISNNCNYKSLNKIIEFIGGNLYRLNNVLNLNSEINILDYIYSIECIYNTKDVVKKIVKSKLKLSYHKTISETDRTSIGLLYHENIIDYYKELKETKYIDILSNFCYTDYIDRITFQKQIWIFNEMSSIIKLMYNNSILKNEKLIENNDEIRFTKVLTKYSTEYNNKMFLIKLSQKINTDIDDLILIFIKDNNYKNDKITELETSRIKKYLMLV